MRIPRASVTTTDASSRQAARCTATLNRVRGVVSGGTAGQQLELEVRSLPSEEREKLLHSAGIKFKVPAGQGLAMRCDIDLPWNQLRELRK